MLLWYNTVLLSFICRLFLPFKKEILGYFMVGRGFLPFVSHRSSGGAAFVRKKFIRWLESRFWDQKSIIASEFFFEKAEIWGLSLDTNINTHCAFFHQILSPNFFHFYLAKQGEMRRDQNIKHLLLRQWETEGIAELPVFSRNYTVAQMVSSENECIHYWVRGVKGSHLKPRLNQRKSKETILLA